jgi:hypothetical protein
MKIFKFWEFAGDWRALTCKDRSSQLTRVPCSLSVCSTADEPVVCHEFAIR